VNFTTWNWDKIDEIVASFARPWQQYICSTSVAFATAWSVVVKADPITVGACVAAATTIATGTAYMRTVDKKTAATAEIAKSTPKPDTTVSAEIK
jgi:hypothetical protein